MTHKLRRAVGETSIQLPAPGIRGGMRVELASTEDMVGLLPDIMRLSDDYSPAWIKMIEDSVRDPDSINVVARDRDGELIGYLTGGMVEKYRIYHPCFGRGDCFMATGIAVRPGYKEKGIGGRMVEDAAEEARSQGYRFIASFTENPRMKKLLDDRFTLVDERVDPWKWINRTYAIDPDDEVDVERELDIRPKRNIKVAEFHEIRNRIIRTPRERIPAVARRVAEELHAASD